MVNCEGDVRDLVRQLVDVESVSGNEAALADMVEEALAAYPHLEVTRLGNVVVARTSFKAPYRVAVAGHLDTVPVAGNLPGRADVVDGRPVLVGRGTCDMKSGLAVQLNLAATIRQAPRDLTWIFYDNEEVEAAKNGLGALVAARPDLVAADMAILMEPSRGAIEAGCQGSVRVHVVTHGVAAHSARSWLGHNAIHDMGRVIDRLNSYHAHDVIVEGLVYREGLNAVRVQGGIAGNIIPDRCELAVNYRFAPDKDCDHAISVVRDLFADWDVEVRDVAQAARPNLNSPHIASLVRHVGQVHPKYGWTDVSRFVAMGIPAVNYGPGDPDLSHTDGEFVFLDEVVDCRDSLRQWLTTAEE